MALDRNRVAQCLREFAFQRLFIEELGWDHPSSRQAEDVTLGADTYMLSPVAEKRGVRIFHCTCVPERNIRQRIEREISKRAYEHLIIFTEAERTRQVWQWVAREKGKPAAFREHIWLTRQEPDPLIQKLDHIAFSLDEEESLTLAGTTLALRDAFDREQITKRFYEAFKAQHTAFLGFIRGLESTADRQWYASLMLNRLMFVYFIQKKGFLDGDIHYLRNRLERVKRERGDNQFHSFYRAFLLRLFHGGLATPADARDAETIRLLGNIPYLNGGLFEPHALEGEHEIEIADAAFEGVFAFFDGYEWTLDTRAIERADGREINPDVLGHIFEKYINQKQMGAYYTKEDITDYITKNTVVPWLFDRAATHDAVAFERGGHVWRMLAGDPDRYIYRSVRHGVHDAQGGPRPLPQAIAAGIEDIGQREAWDRTAEDGYGLPTETWREVVARRDRHAALRAQIAAGEIVRIEDFITLNLDIRQFARDAVQFAESPDLVRAFWRGISAIKVLDPACGSGAFLFAALTILYDLYEACIDRMEEFVASAPEPNAGRAQLYSDFRAVLARIASHPNRPYFIYKSIIIDNLYGTDIMDEAVEICKLRLFLKLAAQLERPDQIEPLPDIDFNVRAGNSLVGYARLDQLRRPGQASLEFSDDVRQIESAAEDLAAAFNIFREQQTQTGAHIDASHKAQLRRRLGDLGARLDAYLAQEYGLSADDASNPGDLARWRTRHKPFHWLAEFFGIMQQGGFDVVVGNPPYIATAKVRKEYGLVGYATEACSDIYACVMERSAGLCSSEGYCGMIVPLSLTFSGSFEPLRDFLQRHFQSNWYSSFARIPAALFSADVRVRNTIHIGRKHGPKGSYTTRTHRWFEEARPHLIELAGYAPFHPDVWNGLIPKLGNPRLLSRLEEAKRQFPPLDRFRSTRPTANRLHFKKSAYNWVSFASSPAPTYDSTGRLIVSSESGEISFDSPQIKNLAHTFLNGKIAFLWWTAVGDDFHVTQANFGNIPFSVANLTEADRAELLRLQVALEADMVQKQVFKLNAGKRVGNYNLARCRPLTDRSDCIWARALGLADIWSDLELAYIQVVKTSFVEDDLEEDANAA